MSRFYMGTGTQNLGHRVCTIGTSISLASWLIFLMIKPAFKWVFFQKKNDTLISQKLPNSINALLIKHFYFSAGIAVSHSGVLDSSKHCDMDKVQKCLCCGTTRIVFSYLQYLFIHGLGWLSYLGLWVDAYLGKYTFVHVSLVTVSQTMW